MASKRKTKRKTIPTQPLVSNPFEAAKRKKLPLFNTKKHKKKVRKEHIPNFETKESENEIVSMPPPPSKQKPCVSRSNTFCSSLPFESSTQDYIDYEDSNLSNHSNPSEPTWLRFKSFDNSQSIDNANQYLTPMDQPQTTHYSQYDITNNRIFNHTKSKINVTENDDNKSMYNNNNNNENNNNNNINIKTEYISRKDLRIPSVNNYLDSSEIIDIYRYKSEQKGIVLNNKYNVNYEEIESLGNGSFGKVYKCRNRNDGCLYAIKKIKIQSIHSNSINIQNKYMKEGYILSSLLRYGNICENIILYNNMWIECEYFYLVTEYINNGNLYNLYNLFNNTNNKLNENIYCKIIENISNALEFIHNKGFVHFDVKPENILISKNCIFKLADFGLCTKINVNDKENNSNFNNMNYINQTNNYNVPKFTEGDSRYLCRELIEQTYKLSELDKIDIFALGLSIYEMIIGKDLPLNGFKWQQIRNGNLNWNNAKIILSNNIKQLIITMIHIDPNQRPSAKQLNIFLRKFSDKILQQKENEITKLKQRIKMLLQQTHHMK